MLHRGLKDKGLRVFGVDSESPDLPRDYLKKYGYTFPTLIDQNENAVSLFHVDGFPTAVLIDAEGKVAYYGSGNEPENLRAALQAIGIW